MRLALLVAFIISAASLASTDIQADLKDFYNLLPTFRLHVVAGKHYFFDRNFRTGLKFLRSNEFKKLLRKDFATSPEVRNIVAYLDYPVSSNFIENSFRSVSTNDESLIRPRSFVSFVDEVIGLVPVNRARALIDEKVHSSDEFRRLYVKVADPEFKRLVYIARNSASLQNAIRKLERNNVNVDRILESVFAVLDKLTK